jgi:cell shape-determining protein MreD
MTAATDEARLARRYRLQMVLAAASVILMIVTAVLPMWIEQLTGLEPDGGSGELEWLFALVPGALSIVFGVLAYRTRRLLATVRADQPRG